MYTCCRALCPAHASDEKRLLPEAGKGAATAGRMHTGRTAAPGRGLAQDLHFPSRYPAAIRAAPLRPLRYGGRETSMP